MEHTKPLILHNVNTKLTTALDVYNREMFIQHPWSVHENIYAWKSDQKEKAQTVINGNNKVK